MKTKKRRILASILAFILSATCLAPSFVYAEDDTAKPDTTSKVDTDDTTTSDEDTVDSDDVMLPDEDGSLRYWFKDLEEDKKSSLTLSYIYDKDGENIALQGATFGIVKIADLNVKNGNAVYTPVPGINLFNFEGASKEDVDAYAEMLAKIVEENAKFVPVDDSSKSEDTSSTNESSNSDSSSTADSKTDDSSIISKNTVLYNADIEVSTDDTSSDIVDTDSAEDNSDVTDEPANDSEVPEVPADEDAKSFEDFIEDEADRSAAEIKAAYNYLISIGFTPEEIYNIYVDKEAGKVDIDYMTAIVTEKGLSVEDSLELIAMYEDGRLSALATAYAEYLEYLDSIGKDIPDVETPDDSDKDDTDSKDEEPEEEEYIVTTDWCKTVYTKITDDEGKCKFENLDPGLYLVMQLDRSGVSRTYYKCKPFIINCPFPITDSGEVDKVGNPVGTWEYDVICEPKTETEREMPAWLEVSVAKVDANNIKYYLKGAEITVFTEDGKVALDREGKPCVGTTDKTGSVKFTVMYDPEIKYYVQETKAPVGYEINPDKFDIVAVYGENGEPIPDTLVIPVQIRDKAIVVPPQTGDLLDNNLVIAIIGAASAAILLMVIASKKIKKNEKN